MILRKRLISAFLSATIEFQVDYSHFLYALAIGESN